MSELSRRSFLGALGASGAVALASTRAKGLTGSKARPNIVLVITDDQGYGDLACHGNPHLRTPHLDRLHGESLRLTRFYTCPVCAPTRAGLMTGRYNYRTGVVDTFVGRAMMHSDEVTMAEQLGKAGYATGIFGKWHLGDNFPMRPGDQGFQEVLVHRGGGIGQPGDPPETDYFDPLLQHNGEQKRFEGYCTDIFFDAAMEYIRVQAAAERPFFCYISTNAPHTPLTIGESYVKPYLDMGLSDDTARLYGMIENLDENMGRLLTALERPGLRENTLLLFMTDNGAQHLGGDDRFNAGLNQWKGSVYEGGIRVPCFVRWPARLRAGEDCSHLAANIDLMPTLLAACGAALPDDRAIDGVDMLATLENPAQQPRERRYFTQWHRGDVPEQGRDYAVVEQRYKLVKGTELYDLEADPGETKNLAVDMPEKAAAMRAAYEAWFANVSATRGYDPPRIVVGAPQENPALLTRQDWRGVNGWGDGEIGHWLVDVAQAWNYEITVQFPPADVARTAHFRLGELHLEAPLDAPVTEHVFSGASLQSGCAKLEAWVSSHEKSVGAQYVTVRREA
jgi:arylsulfatase A-like enzyme